MKKKSIWVTILKVISYLITAAIGALTGSGGAGLV